ncbi:putative short-chain dehydrogenase [Talaromyces proteolyticus]|uniref:Short-chain dehydrogenase n=1 Tax=Talaromyces proteolyticus TaxID=1131652 RepID=A0AAD4KMY5_9EURO|nr:putative short-chain dehydrogenase [Talaromyces proteolyticus]KAH8696402.1 putative short-chain dehydrogenase [Talaromyces proteolyticus]
MVQFNGPYGKVSPSYQRRAVRNPPAQPTKNFAGKTVLVTGCNTGVGYEAALKIAGLNPKKLILGTRTVAKGEITKSKILAQVPALDSSVVDVIAIEYTSFKSVSQFADTVKRSTKSLDCVLLSAGLASPKHQLVEGGWEMAYKVNVLSTALVTVELLPLLKATPGSVLEFVDSAGYCNVMSKDVSPILDDESASTLQFFNDPKRWTLERGYCEPKLLLMFVLEGLVEALGGRQGKLGSPEDPILLACCPGQCKTDLGRNFPLSMRLFMVVYNAIHARSAEEGSRTLVTGLFQGEEANGRLWVNDQFDDLSPGLTEAEWKGLQKRVWREVWGVLKEYNPELSI